MDRKLFSDSATQSRTLGLSKKATYEDLVAYIERDPDRIKYPNRKAKIVRNSFELSQLDGMGQLEISRQHEITLMNQEAQVLLQRFAQDNDLPLGDVQAYVSNLGLVPLHEHHARRIFQLLGGEGGEPPPAANNGVLVNGQVAVAGQPGAPPLQPPELAQPVPVHLQNLGGVVFGPPPPLPVREASRADRPTRASGSNSGGYIGSTPALNQLPRFDPSRRESVKPGTMHPGSFTFLSSPPQMDNPPSYITSDNLALYIRKKQTTRFREIPYMHRDLDRPVAATPLIPRAGKTPGERFNRMNPTHGMLALTDAPPHDAPAEPSTQQNYGLLSPLFTRPTAPLALTDAPTTVFIMRDMFTRALGRMGLRAEVRGADEEAEGRAQMLALTDIQRQEATRDHNVAIVSQAARSDLAQEGSFRPVRRSKFDRRHGWDPVQPGYTPIPLGLSFSSGAASSSLGLAPEPPAADAPTLTPAAASTFLPAQSVSRTRIRQKTPPPRTAG